MLPTTNTYGNIYRPGTRSTDSSAGRDLSITEARSDLLAQHRVDIPPRGTVNTGALYKFIDGEPLSRKDCLELSRWLQTPNLPNADLLGAMQRAEPSFVFILNLTRPPQETQNLIYLLMDVCDQDLTFGLSMTAVPPDSVAHVVREVMTSPQSRVTSFTYLAPAGPREDIKTILQEAIAKCSTLKRVNGCSTVLQMLSRSVPDIELTALARLSDEERNNLRGALDQGGVEKLSFKSDVQDEHERLVQTVADANTHLSPDRSVHHVDVNTFAKQPDLSTETIVTGLLSIRHLKELTLPSTSWIVPYGMHISDRWDAALQSLKSLQTLNFHSEEPHVTLYGRDPARIEDTIAMLGPVLERNRRRAYLEASNAAELLICAATNELFTESTHKHLIASAGYSIDPLQKWLGETLGDGNGAQKLKVLSKATAAAAAKGRKQARLEYKNRLAATGTVAPQSQISGTNAEPRRPTVEHLEDARATRISQFRSLDMEAEPLPTMPMDPLEGQPMDLATFDTLVQDLTDLISNVDPAASQPGTADQPSATPPDKT